MDHGGVEGETRAALCLQNAFTRCAIAATAPTHRMTSPHETVFVYGTLRRGGSNHFRMAAAAFVSKAAVRGRIYQIDWYPGLVLDEAVGDVVGEVYQVSGTLLEELDVFEGTEYRRVRVEVNCGGDHRSPLPAWVWEWLGPVDETRRITSGDWLSPPRSMER